MAEKLDLVIGMVQSMSDKGNCYDNAVAESLFHTLKTELVYHMKFQTKEEAKRAISEYKRLGGGLMRKIEPLKNFGDCIYFLYQKGVIDQMK